MIYREERELEERILRAIEERYEGDEYLRETFGYKMLAWTREDLDWERKKELFPEVRWDRIKEELHSFRTIARHAVAKELGVSYGELQEKLKELK
jgi:hypothetical protein